MQECLERLEKVENIVVKYQDRLKDKSEFLHAEYGLSTSTKMQEDIEAISDEARLMKIGIIGRVKAGKSSLINALIFDGQNILPAAATPMTAALTQIRYAKEYSVEVEFFSSKDIENIKQKAEEFQKELDKELQQAKEKVLNKLKKDEDILAPIKRRLMSEKEVLGASYQQYEKIRSSSLQTQNFTTKVASFDNLEELQESLYDYVGAEGKYMPFTKSVNIYLPEDSLEGISIVDTPGFNDPVISREARTKEELDQCDVVFVVSSSGQFINEEDEKLMDRISSKNGVREIYVVASKCDSQLYGSIKDEANGNFIQALEILTQKHTKHLAQSLQQLKIRNPEVGDVFDGLIENNRDRVLYSSGICRSIIENKDKLNPIEEHTLKLLQKNYPDNFSSLEDETTLASLKKLGNIEAIKENLNAVSLKKEEIKNQKTEDYLAQKEKIIQDYIAELIQFTQDKRKEIQNTDIEELKKQQKEIQNIKTTAGSVLDDTYQDMIMEFEANLPMRLNAKFNTFFRSATSSVDEAESTETRSEERTRDKGCGFFFWRSLTGNRYETYTAYWDVTTVRINAVKNALRDLRTSIENAIQEECFQNIKNIKDSLRTKLLRELRNAVGDDYINVNHFRQATNTIVVSLQMPQINFSNKKLPEGSGVLEGSEAERFVSEAQDFIDSLRDKVSADIQSYVSNLASNLKGIPLSDKIFGEYDEKLQGLQSDIENQKVALAELDSIEKELKN